MSLMLPCQPLGVLRTGTKNDKMSLRLHTPLLAVLLGQSSLHRAPRQESRWETRRRRSDGD